MLITKKQASARHVDGPSTHQFGKRPQSRRPTMLLQRMPYALPFHSEHCLLLSELSTRSRRTLAPGLHALSWVVGAKSVVRGGVSGSRAQTGKIVDQKRRCLE